MITNKSKTLCGLLLAASLTVNCPAKPSQMTTDSTADRIDETNQLPSYMEKAKECYKHGLRLRQSADEKRDALFCARENFKEAFKWNLDDRVKLDACVNYGDVNMQIGEFLWDWNAYGKAEESYRIALKQIPDDSVLHCKLGKSLLMQGIRPGKEHKLSQSKKEIEKALELNKNNAEAMNVLGEWYAKTTKNSVNGEDLFKKAIKTNPDCLEAYCNLASVYIQEKKYDAAINLLNESLKLDAEQHKAYFWLAAVYEKKKEIETALKYIQKARELVPFEYKTRETVLKEKLKNPDVNSPYD